MYFFFLRLLSLAVLAALSETPGAHHQAHAGCHSQATMEQEPRKGGNTKDRSTQPALFPEARLWRNTKEEEPSKAWVFPWTQLAASSVWLAAAQHTIS